MSSPPTAVVTPGREPIPVSSPDDSKGYHRTRRIPILALIIACSPIIILALVVGELLYATGGVNFGLGFWGSTWNPPEDWGIAVFIVGSFITAIPALFFAMAIGLGIAIASTVYLPRNIAQVLDSCVDFLAGIPSVVYGIWGYLFVATIFGTRINPWLYTHFYWVPGFGAPAPLSDGIGLPLAIFILTLMALPITTLLIRDSLRAVPRDLWEAGLGMGATRWETTRKVAIPYGSRGILSAAFLGFGRAFGETVAVAMVINAIAAYPLNFYHGTATMAAWMFLNLDAAIGNSQWLAALAEMALVLLGISLAVNIAGRRLVARVVSYEVAGL